MKSNSPVIFLLLAIFSLFLVFVAASSTGSNYPSTGDQYAPIVDQYAHEGTPKVHDRYAFTQQCIHNLDPSHTPKHSICYPHDGSGGYRCLKTPEDLKRFEFQCLQHEGYTPTRVSGSKGQDDGYGGVQWEEGEKYTWKPPQDSDDDEPLIGENEPEISTASKEGDTPQGVEATEADIPPPGAGESVTEVPSKPGRSRTTRKTGTTKKPRKPGKPGEPGEPGELTKRKSHKKKT